MICKNCRKSKSEHYQFFAQGNFWCTEDVSNNQVFEAERICGHGVPVERCPALPAVELPPLLATKSRYEDWSNFWKRVAEEREEQLRAALKELATAQRIANNALDRAERLMPR